MSVLNRIDKVILTFEQLIVVALQLLIVVVVFVSTVVLFALAIDGLRRQAYQIGNVADLLSMVQRSIAGVLIVVLGLEVLETLKAYFRDHHVRLEVILVVAIIAASRYLVQLDFEHATALGLFGISAVITSLCLGYFLVKKALFAYPTDALDRGRG
jgi:uncharacterized membrane protein (DUF373 family)